MTDEQASATYGGDFDEIEAAVRETPRGRWFLGEFARRNRVAETDVLLEAIRRLEHGVSEPEATGEADRLRAAMARMAEAIGRAKAAVADLGSATGRPDPNLGAAELLTSVGLTAAAATADILRATGRIQEIARTLREAGSDGAVCEELDRRAAQICTACAFQSDIAERTKAVLQALESLDEYLPDPADSAAAEVGPGRPPSRPEADRLAENAPASRPDLPGPAGLESASGPDMERVWVADPWPAARNHLEWPEPAQMGGPPQAVHAGRTLSLDKLLAIDRLDIRERLKLFT